MSKETDSKAPLLHKTDKKESDVKEQLIYGNGKTLKETDDAKKKYKNNKLNE